MSAEHSTASTSGVILAGTFPWANSAFDRLSPRPLVPVAHRALIAHGLSWLQNAGMRNVIVCANRNSRDVETQLALNFSDIDLTYLEDTMPRGAAGCVADAANTCDSQTFVVTDAAAIPTVNLRDLLRAHWNTGAAATVVVYHEASGPVQAALQVPAGVYVFEHRILDQISRSGFADIKEHLIPALVRRGEKVTTFVTDSPVPRVLDAKTYLAVNEFVTQQMVFNRTVPEGYSLIAGSLIHRDATVEPDAILVGPVMVGPCATIQSRAVVIGPTSIGSDVTVASGALVSRSAVWRRSRVQENAIVDRSILADGAIIGRDRQVYGTVVASDSRSRTPGRAVASRRF